MWDYYYDQFCENHLEHCPECQQDKYKHIEDCPAFKAEVDKSDGLANLAYDAWKEDQAADELESEKPEK